MGMHIHCVVSADCLTDVGWRTYRVNLVDQRFLCHPSLPPEQLDLVHLSRQAGRQDLVDL